MNLTSERNSLYVGKYEKKALLEQETDQMSLRRKNESSQIGHGICYDI